MLITLLLSIGIPVLYTVIGLVLARIIFNRTMGTAERRRQLYSGSITEWTSEFTSAIWIAVFTIPFWPLVFPVTGFVFSDTTHEKQIKQKQKQIRLDREKREFEHRFKELEAEVLAFGKKL